MKPPPGAPFPAAGEECSFSGGEAANVLPEKVCLVGTMRTTVEATRTRFKKRIEAICAGMAQAFGAKAEVEFTQGIPSVYNEPARFERAVAGSSHMLPYPLRRHA